LQKANLICVNLAPRSTSTPPATSLKVQEIATSQLQTRARKSAKTRRGKLNPSRTNGTLFARLIIEISFQIKNWSVQIWPKHAQRILIKNTGKVTTAHLADASNI
jgi:hypothetical protein